MKVTQQIQFILDNIHKKENLFKGRAITNIRIKALTKSPIIGLKNLTLSTDKKHKCPN